MDENDVKYQKVLSQGTFALLKGHDIYFYLIEDFGLVEFIVRPNQKGNLYNYEKPESVKF